ncbi:AraC family transcriptional regulator [Winogradskyella ursingii]|uniref:AraC family transcriptional regulator n=1 Tax=Winogradskyella ursingii TaxID=2686079 RepID=UPI0015CD13BA|nr:AraC family transcriptional regulator [Winogradskyella ursingii]
MNDSFTINLQNGCNNSHDYFRGKIEQIELIKQLTLFNFNFQCLGAFSAKLESDDNTSIYIIVNMAQKPFQITNSDGVNKCVGGYSSILLPLSNAHCITFNYETDTLYNIVVLKVTESHFDDGQLQLLQSYKPKYASAISIPNLAMNEIVGKLIKLDKETCEDSCMATGYCNIIVGLQLKTIQKKEEATYLSSFRCYEIEQLEKLTNSIKDKPYQDYSIKDMCKQTGLSSNKLQNGFKEMHNHTVAIYVRNKRLDMAVELLGNPDLNISEIVYTIGLSSRSYFSRIFKERFNCSPLEYRSKIMRSRNSQ